MNTCNFKTWWDREGKSFDPDTEEVPWSAKRRDLAEKAWDVAMAQGANYTANDVELPTEVAFANGRKVKIVFGSHLGTPHLEITGP